MKVHRFTSAVIFLIAGFVVTSATHAVPSITDKINWQTMSSGGKTSGGGLRIQQAIGQTAAGFSAPASSRCNSGYEQTLPTGCCVYLTGNVDCDPGDGVDISDLSRLIDYLYISFSPLCCSGEANVDGDLLGGVDISDLSNLIDYLYISFTPPAGCQ